MRKKVFLIVGVLAGLLALGIAGGAVLAQEAISKDKDGAKGNAKSEFYDAFIARVAEILDQDEDDVRSAIETAREETREAWREEREEKFEERREAYRERLEEKLDAAIEDGKITQDEADEYLERFDDKSDGAAFGRGFGKKHRGFGHSRGWDKHK